MGNFIFQAALAYALGKIASSLLEVEPETPLRDEKAPTLSTKGSFAPIVIGERKIAPVISWIGNRTLIQESVDNGGKGVGGGGGNTQDVYFEDGIHLLAVGPGEKLRNIVVNGEKLLFNNGVEITRTSHPSGSAIDVLSSDSSIFKGQFEIFWGEQNQPLDDWTNHPSRLGINSRWPYLFRINWRQFRLGGFAVWPTIEYEIQVRPFSFAGTQITGAASWGMNAPGKGTVRDIQSVQNSDISGDTASFSVSGDQTSEFVAGGYASVTGQTVASVNRLYLIKTVNFASLDTHYRSAGALIPTIVGTIPTAISSWIPEPLVDVTTLGLLTSGVSWPEGESSTEGNIYRCRETETNIIIAKKSVQVSTVNVGDGENLFSTGIQTIDLWVRGLREVGQATTAVTGQWAPWIEVGFADGNPTSGANSAYARLEYDSISRSYVTTEVNGCKVTNAQGDNTGIWTKLSISFKTNTGASDQTLTDIDPRRVFIRWANAGFGNNVLDIYTKGKLLITENRTNLKEDDGVLITGLTHVIFDEHMEGGVEDIGNITALIPGTGNGGANMAHILEQFLFETFPHGAGLDRSSWDMISLNQLAIDADTEQARLHVIADRGKNIAGTIALILQDMHGYISWDPIQGKYIFGLIRDPGVLPVPSIPIEAILSPEPEVETLHQFNTPNMIVFGFPNRDKNYRVDTVPIDDDATAGIVNNRIIKNVKISFATDFFFAEQIAERRQTEDLIPATKYKIFANREARLLTPGISFLVEGINEPLRLIGIKTDPDTSKVELEAVTDIYAIKGATVAPPSSPGFGGPPPHSPLEDLFTKIWELPPFLSQNIVSIAIPRIRADSHTGNSQVLLSTDNITYTIAKGQAFVATGGALTVAIPASSKLELTGTSAPSISALGEDILRLTNTLTTERWKTGDQLALIGDEIFYLKQLVPRGGGVYHMDGLIRARLGSSKTAHSVGDTVFIFPRNSIRRIIDPFLIPETPIYIKTVPQGVSVPTITAKNPTLTGIGVKPIAVTAVRTPTGSPSYSTGEDITIRWNFHLPLSLASRGGAGFQTAGEPMGEPMVGPQTFRVTIVGGALGRVIETTVPTITYTNAQILFDNTTEFSPTFRVEMIYNGYASPITSYQVTLV